MRLENITGTDFNNRYKLTIFDMDGTILNTIDDLTDATNYALRKHGLRELTVKEECMIVGNGLFTTAKRAVPEGTDEETLNAVFTDFAAYYKEHNEDKTRPYEGIVEVIHALRKAGVKTAVVSNKADYAVKSLVKKYFEDCFDMAMGETPGFALKPDKAMVDEILRSLGTERNDAVYIGDSNVDLLTAENSGMDCIAVSWGFRGHAKLLEYGAKTIIDKPEEILDLIIQSR